jgi:ribosome biogenesis GTPase A
VLLDARCPPLHLPPSLVAYLQRFGRRRTLLVLTKADLVPAPLVAAWAAWLRRTYEWRVVATESYAKLERLEGQGELVLLPFPSLSLSLSLCRTPY